MLIKSIALFTSGALLLTGCSIGIPNPDDAAACEQMNTVLVEKLESLPTGGFDATKLLTLIETDVVPVAPEGLQTNLKRLTDALATDPLSTTEVATAGSEIAIRCALVGVNLEFPNPADLLLG